MKCHRLLIGTVLLVSTLVSACAIDRTTDDACADEMTQDGMNDCHFRAWKAADAEMSHAYETLMQRVKEQHRLATLVLGRELPAEDKLLGEAQAAWIDYRDKHCAFVAAGTEGGSVQPMIHALCLTELTEQRMKQFNAQLTCPEGDLSCVAPRH